MKMKKILSVLLVFLLFVSVPQSAIAAQADWPASEISADVEEAMKKKVLALVNEERAKTGASSLGRNSTLTRAADIRAREIAKLFSHTRPDGTECFTAFKDVGITSFSWAGENIAYNYGYSDPAAQVMTDWMNSPGHKANILKKEYELVGIGLYVQNGRYCWTQMFYTGSQLKAEAEKEPPKPTVAGFSDVYEDDYYADAVEWAVENNITSGTDKTHFSPNTSCTRAQAVTFLWRAAGEPNPQNTTTQFNDVKAGSYYEKAVQWAVENGVTSGTGETTFSPNATCTRAQIVTFLYRAEGSPETAEGGGFTDVKAGEYYADAVKWAVEREITSGTGGNRFSPENNCIRGQIVTFLYRYKN